MEQRVLQTTEIGGQYLMYENIRLGKGAYGEVFLGEMKGTKEQIAVKRMNIREMERHKVSEKELYQEASLQKQLNHKNIVRFIDIRKSEDKKYIYIILEYCNGETIKKYLESHDNNISATQALDIVRQFTNGYHYLHSFRDRVLVHRDIKSDNLLVHKDSNGQMVFKLADFGFSRSVSDEATMMTSVLGTPLYMSPELHLGKAYTSKTDVFSLGVLFFQIYYGCNPWDFRHGPHDNPRMTPLEVLVANIKRTPINQILASQRIQAIQEHKKRQFNEREELTQFCDLIIYKCLQFEETNRESWQGLFELINQIDIQQKDQSLNSSHNQTYFLYLLHLQQLQSQFGYLAQSLLAHLGTSTPCTPPTLETQHTFFICAYLVKLGHYINQYLSRQQKVMAANPNDNSALTLLESDLQMILLLKQDFMFHLTRFQEHQQLQVIRKFLADESWDIENFDKDKLPLFIQKHVDELKQQHTANKNSPDSPADNRLPITLAAFLDTIGLKWLLDFLFEKLQVFLLHINQQFKTTSDNNDNNNKKIHNINDTQIINNKSKKSVPLIYLELLQFALVIEGLDRSTEDIKLQKNIFYNLLVTQQEMQKLTPFHHTRKFYQIYQQNQDLLKPTSSN